MKAIHSLFFLLLIYLSGCYSKVSDKTGLEGQPMPSFKLLLPDSTTYLDSKDLKVGRPIVLLYYSPRCPYCRAQIKNIIENIDKLGDILFCLVTNYSLKEMKQFGKTYNLNKYHNIINGQDINNSVSNYYEVQGVPYLAIYGKNKKLNQVFEGKAYTSYIIKAAFR